MWTGAGTTLDLMESAEHFQDGEVARIDAAVQDGHGRDGWLAGRHAALCNHTTHSLTRPHNTTRVRRPGRSPFGLGARYPFGVTRCGAPDAAATPLCWR
jgi:hypothetical protein